MEVRYRDLDFLFKRNLVSSDVSTVSGVDAIKASLRNLIKTKRYDRPFQPDIDSGVSGLLFENFNPLTESNMKSMVEELARNYEPRVRILEVKVRSSRDNNRFEMTIQFTINNVREPQLLNVTLERIR